MSNLFTDITEPKSVTLIGGIFAIEDDDAIPVMSMDNSRPVEEKRQARMAQCGTYHLCYNSGSGTFRHQPYFCRERDCAQCEIRRCRKELRLLNTVLEFATVPVYQTTFESKAAWQAYVKETGLKKSDFRRYPQLDGSIIAFVQTTTPPPDAGAPLKTDTLTESAMRQITDQPYARRDGKTINISGNLGRGAVKPKPVDGVVVNLEDVFIYDASKKVVSQAVYEDLSLQVTCLTIDLAPTTLEEHIAYTELIQRTLMRLAHEQGYTTRTILRKETFSNNLDHITPVWTYYRRCLAPEGVKRGYLKALPAQFVGLPPVRLN